jgi:hypothetical protein
MQVAPVNYVSGSYAACRSAWSTTAPRNRRPRAQALQIGVFNGSDFIKSCKIGVINIAREMIGSRSASSRHPEQRRLLPADHQLLF